MLDKMKQIMEMQKKAKEVQKALEALKVERTTPGGKIRLVMNGNHRVESLSIDPGVFTPDHREEIEQALAKLMTEAAEDVKQRSAAQAMEMMKGLDLKLPGF